MSKRTEKVLYMSGDETGTDEYDSDSQAENDSGQPETVELCMEKPSQNKRPPGMRARDENPVRAKKHECPHCNRPYCQKPALNKHVLSCPVKLKADSEYAEKLRQTKDSSVRKLQQKEYYEKVIKPKREARRPIDYVPKPRGQKPKPRIVEVSEDSESEIEPETIIVRKKKPTQKPAPKPAPKPRRVVKYESESESESESDYDRAPPPRPTVIKPPPPPPPPRYVIRF